MRNHSLALCVLCSVAVLFIEKTFADEAAPKPAIGSEVPNFTFTDSRYLPRQLSEFGEKKAFVIVFTTLDCPIVKRSLPKLKKLDADFRDLGVQFLAINVGPEDALVDVAYQAVKADIAFPFGKDFTGSVAKTLGCTRTPECVVLDSQRRLKYRGRMDSEFRLSGASPNAGRQDLREAIDDVLAGRKVQAEETPVDGCLITSPRKPEPKPLTFHKDVAPLMKQHCQRCHQPGGSAPFSLRTLEDASAHAEMIAEVVTQRRMPPWHAASAHGEFTNNPRLSSDEIAIIAGWANGERIAGNPADAPEPLPVRESDWLIGKPDLVIKLPAPNTIPATGYVPYHYALLPYVFLKDTWVQKIQINPSNNAAVHHCNMGYVSLAEAGEKVFHPEKNFITGYVPGGDPMVLKDGVGFRIPAGSVVGLQLHYISTGEETTDQTEVGFVFAKEKIQKQIQHFQCHTSRFEIPPGASHHPVKASKTFAFDATGVGMYSHMHLRGKDMTFEAVTPDGKPETLLSIPNYNFEWQASYRWPENKIKFSKGTRIDCTAHFDNSTFNPYNPDPKAAVRHGLQTYEEMMYGFVFFTRDDEALNLTIDSSTGHVISDSGNHETHE